MKKKIWIYVVLAIIVGIIIGYLLAQVFSIQGNAIKSYPKKTSVSVPGRLLSNAEIAELEQIGSYEFIGEPRQIITRQADGTTLQIYQQDFDIPDDAVGLITSDKPKRKTITCTGTCANSDCRISGCLAEDYGIQCSGCFCFSASGGQTCSTCTCSRSVTYAYS